jgi:hypothetical protein
MHAFSVQHQLIRISRVMYVYALVVWSGSSVKFALIIIPIFLVLHFY